MPAVANPITFGKASRNYGYRSPSRIGFDDLPYLQRPGMTRGVPTYTVGGGTGKPFRPGVGQRTGGGETGGTIVSGYSPISYNPNTRSGSFDVADGAMGPVSYEDILKNAAVGGLAYGGLGSLSQKLLGTNLTGETLGSGFLGQIPFLGQGLRNAHYWMNPSISSAYAAGGLPKVGSYIGEVISRVPGAISNIPSAVSNYVSTTSPSAMFTDYTKALDSVLPGGGSVLRGAQNLVSNMGSGIGSLAQKFSPGVSSNAANRLLMNQNVGNLGPSTTFGGVSPSAGTQAANRVRMAQTRANAGPSQTFGSSKGVASNQANRIAKQNVAGPEYKGISGFFNQPRAFLTGKDGIGLFGTPGELGSGISSVGNVLGTVGGLLSLKSFIDDPSLASGLGTLAGAGASGISAFSGLATAAPWLAGAALVAGLLMNKKPSNKTGYTTIDLDEFKPLSFGMEGKKYSQENVDQTMKIMEPIIPLIQELEKQYGVDLKGDIQVNYGGRDGLAYNIGNRDVTGFRNRLDYFDGRDQSTRDGGSIFRKTFKGENAGKDFYNSLLGDLETLAKQKQAEGGGVIDLSGYRGVQRQMPQGVFSYGIPGGGMIPSNVTAPPKPKGGPQGVFTYGYNT